MKRKHQIHRWTSVFLLAWMLGVSNVLDEETRMMNDSYIKIEAVQEVPDDEPV